MFGWKLTEKLFDGFTILRWTDFIKPIECVEIEKHAIKSILTYIIGQEYEEKNGNKKTGYKLDWSFIVRNNVLGLLSKIATSDIKNPINARIKKENADSLKDFIINIYYDADDKPKFFPEKTVTKLDFEIYFEDDIASVISDKRAPDAITPEKLICYFAHKYATYREFCILKDLNKLSPDIDTVETNIKDILDRCNDICDDLKGGNTLKGIFTDIRNEKSELHKFFTYFEKLKPQVRWSQTCRLPATTVLGHCMYVAVLTYFAIKEMDITARSGKNVIVDSFYAALFHDLPESLTRDIISPVKRNLAKFEEDFLARYEYEEIRDKMVDNCFIRHKRPKWIDKFLMLLGKSKREDGVFVFKPFVTRPDTTYPTVLGELIQYLDKISAFAEAKISVNSGVESAELQNGIQYTSDVLFNKVYEFKYGTSLGSAKNPELRMNDYFASIPNYKIGSGQ